MSLKKLTKRLTEERELKVTQEAEAAKLNQEMIAYQNDKPFIEAAKAAIQNVFDKCGVDNSNLNKGDGLIAIKELEDLFSKRFGVKVIFGWNNTYDAYTITNCPTFGYDTNKFDNLFGTYEVLEKFKEKDPKFYDNMVNGNIDLSDPKYNDVNKWFKDLANISYYSLLDQIKKTGLTLDIKNAKIINPPKNYSVYINVDWYHDATTYDLTPEEELGALLHEFGHNWYRLENLMRLYANVDILNDVLREEYGSNNKTPVETLKIFYNKTKLDMPKNLPNNIVAATLMAYQDIIRGSSYTQETIGFLTNNEASSDEFASRFGLGRAFISGLQKTYKGVDPTRYDRYQYSLDDLRSDIGTSLIMGTIAWGLLFGSIIQVGAIAAGAVLFTGGIALIISIFVGYFLTSKSAASVYEMFKNRGSFYDNIDRRYKKIRNTTIRRLNWVTDINIKKAILKDIEEIDAEMKPILESLANSKLRKLTEYFAKDTASYKEQKLNELLEDLNANEIYVASNIFKTMKL